jgi:NAD(P)H-dependent flavin oxidoreductase YrpB (nitropropane dioxygenase family)
MHCVPARDLPPVIQGGMGVGVSSWQLAQAVASAGGLGVVSGVAPDLLLARWLQDGDPTGTIRAALESFPDQELVARTLARFYRPNGRDPKTPYRPIPRLDHHQRLEAVRLAVLGSYVQVRLAKSGHSGRVGINLLEKIQVWTPAVLLGAMLADVDVVLVGAGLPTHLPRLLDGLAKGEPVRLPLDVVDAQPDDQFLITLDPHEVVPPLRGQLKRPTFLAIVSSHILGAYLMRDEQTRPDGLVVEGPVAGGHNAPPRGKSVDERGEPVYGPRDHADLEKLRTLGLPFWLAGGQASPHHLAAARQAGAIGVQIGTAFALSHESGLSDPLRRTLLSRVSSHSVNVRTDPVASPTGFPFKVVELPETVATADVYEARERTCDLGYLRTPYRRDDGTIGQRCPAEPTDAYVRKGGLAEDTVAKVCLCNGLTASAGLAQYRRHTGNEPPLLTLGQDLASVYELLEAFPDGWSARDVMTWVMTGAPLSDEQLARDRHSQDEGGNKGDDHGDHQQVDPRDPASSVHQAATGLLATASVNRALSTAG